jgi:hypothetical protein
MKIEILTQRKDEILRLMESLRAEIKNKEILYFKCEGAVALINEIVEAINAETQPISNNVGVDQCVCPSDLDMASHVSTSQTPKSKRR